MYILSFLELLLLSNVYLRGHNFELLLVKIRKEQIVRYAVSIQDT